MNNLRSSLYSQQIGVLAFINGGEEGKALYNAFVTGRVCYEVYKRLSVSQADVLRVGCIMVLKEFQFCFFSDFIQRHLLQCVLTEFSHYSS